MNRSHAPHTRPSQASIDTSADPAGHQARSSHASAPVLWNPAASVMWSFLFTPVFGAVLHMKNWQALGNTVEAVRSRNWAMGSAAFMLASFIAFPVLPKSPATALIWGIGYVTLFLAWVLSNAKRHVAHVKARFGKNYKRENWDQPFLIAIYAAVALQGVLAVVHRIRFGYFPSF